MYKETSVTHYTFNFEQKYQTKAYDGSGTSFIMICV